MLPSQLGSGNLRDHHEIWCSYKLLSRYLIRVVRYQILYVCVHIHSLLEVKSNWSLVLLALQVHLYHLRGTTQKSGCLQTHLSSTCFMNVH